MPAENCTGHNRNEPTLKNRRSIAETERYQWKPSREPSGSGQASGVPAKVKVGISQRLVIAIGSMYNSNDLTHRTTFKKENYARVNLSMIIKAILHIRNLNI